MARSMFLATRGPTIRPSATPRRALLVLDLLTPEYGSLAAAGIPATTVRVVVDPLEVVAPGPPDRRHLAD